MRDINDFKNTLLRLAEKHALDMKNGDWSTDYNQDWSAELEARSNIMFSDLAHLAEALSRGDDVGQLTALLRMRARLLDVSNFFSDIYDDVDSLINNEEIGWPEIPEDYVYTELKGSE